jgi:hypothetical protein
VTKSLLENRLAGREVSGWSRAGRVVSLAAGPAGSSFWLSLGLVVPCRRSGRDNAVTACRSQIPESASVLRPSSW